MQTLMPSGELWTEFFEDEDKMKRRRKVLEELGGKVQRVLHVTTNSKYMPHEGSREIARRLRQMQRDEANRAKRAANSG